MVYIKENWVNVPDPLKPPEGAVPIDANLMDKIEQGIADAHDFINEIKEEITEIKDNDAKFTPLFSTLVGDYHSTSCFCLSPNKKYVAVIHDALLSLYRTADMSLVGEMAYNYNDPDDNRIDMDDNFIITCYSSQYHGSSYNFGSGDYKFYTYDDNGIAETSISSTLTGRLTEYNASSYNTYGRATGGDNNFWFIIEKGLDTSEKDVYLCLLRKNAGIVQEFKLPYGYYDNDGDSIFGKTGMIRDGDAVYVWMYQHGYAYLERVTTSLVRLDRYDAEGVNTILFNSSSSKTGYSETPSDLIPLASSVAVDIDSQQIFISGWGGSSYGNVCAVASYPFNGNLDTPLAKIYGSRTSVAGMVAGEYRSPHEPQYPDKSLGIIDGKWYVGSVILDPITLEPIAYTKSAVMKPIATSTTDFWDGGNVYNCYPNPITGSIYYNVYPSATSSIEFIFAKDLEFGGMLK